MKKNNILKITLLILFGILISSNINSTKVFATNIDYKFTMEDFENNLKTKNGIVNNKNQDGKFINPFVDFFILRTIEKNKDYIKEVKTFNEDIKDILNDIEFKKIQTNELEIVEDVEEDITLEDTQIEKEAMVKEKTIKEEPLKEENLPKVLTREDILARKGIVVEKPKEEKVEDKKEENKKEENIEVPKEVVPTSKQITDKAYEDALNYLKSINIEEVKSKLGWSRIMCIGDSLTEGVQSGVDEPFPNSWPGVMGNLLNISIENNGIGGSTIWTDGEYAMCDRILDCGDADAIFVMGGTNDWFFGHQCPMGDLNTPNTFTYDVNKLYSHIASKYNGADVFIILPLETNGHAGVEPFEPFNILRDIERNLAANYGFNVIDLVSENMFNPTEKEVGDLYFSDFCHLSTKGYEMLGTIIAAKSISMVNK